MNKNISHKIVNKISKVCESVYLDIIDDIAKTHKISKEKLKKYHPKYNTKKRKNAYTIFSSKYRSTIQKENPDKNFGQISKIIGEMWKNLEKKEKDKYYKMAEDYKLIQ